MIITVEPAIAPTAPPDARPHLRLVVVRTPQPPLEDERVPVRLVLPGVVPPRPAHRPGPRPRTSTRRAADADFGPCLSGRAELPDVRRTGRQLITPGVFTVLARGNRPQWCAEGTAPLVVGPLHVCEPVDGVAEVSAVARRAGQAHAVAARLEGIDGRWRCTALQIG
jgi:Family of unknown function (DUF6459)